MVEQLRAEEAAAKARKEGPKELGDIDTDDEKDPDAEYEAWRMRELRRIRCDALPPWRAIPRLTHSWFSMGRSARLTVPGKRLCARPGKAGAGCPVCGRPFHFGVTAGHSVGCVQSPKAH